MARAIRPARPEDAAQIAAIYNDAVLKTTATMDTDPRTPEQSSAWFEQHGGRYPVVVAEDKAKGVIGWASLSRWSDRRAYGDTAEVSVYVAEAERGKGHGTRLLGAVMEAGRKQGLHTVIARIAGDNEASVKLHTAAGFTPVGVMKEVGWKFGRRIDVLVMQCLYGAKTRGR